MSEFLAEGLVVVKPDTSKFRAELEAKLKAIAIPPITVPVIAAGAGLAAAASATASVAAAQKILTQTTTEAIAAQTGLTTSFVRQAAILPVVTAETQAVAGAQAVLDAQAKKTTLSMLGAASASSRLDAALLGLRTVVGGTAVIGLGALALSAIVAGKAVRSIIGNAAALERELNTFRATTQATAEEMTQVAEAAEQLGADIRLPGVSALDAAEAMTELSKAGLSVEDSISGARGVLQLATAASIDNAAATELAANALNSFDLAGTQAVQVADLLAGASIAAQGDITDMGIALQQVSAVARQVGFSLQATITAIALLAQNGLRGSDAGTSLRTALIRLINPTEKARAKIRDLGIEIRDVAGNVRVDVFEQFAQATRNLSSAQRDAALAIVFGQDAIRAAAILAREGIKGFAEAEKTVTKAGNAADLSAAKSQGLAGAWEGLRNQATRLGQSIGEDVTPFLETYARGLTDIIETTNNASAALDRLTKRRQAQGFADLAQEIGRLQQRIDDLRSSGRSEHADDLQSFLDELVQQLRGQMNPALLEEADASDRARVAIDALTDAHERMTPGVVEVAKEVNEFAKALRGLRRDAQIAQDALLRLQSEGGTRGQQLTALEADIAAQREIIEAARRGPARGRATRIREARSQIVSDLAQIESIQSEIESDRKRAIADAKKRAEEAARQARELTEAFIESFSSEEQLRENRILKARQTERLSDDLKRNRELRAFFKDEIKAIRERIKDLRLRGDALKAAKEEIKRVSQEIFQIQQDIIETQKEQAERIKQAVLTRIDLRIQIAEAREDVRAQIRLRIQRLQLLRKELQKLIKQHKGNTIAALELRVAIAEEEKAIKDLKEKTKERNDRFKELAFEFLQRQQGFAANLLGNLIPGFATGGLVGNIPPAAQVPPRQTRGEIAAERDAALADTRGRGARAGQVETTNQLLRAILRSLQNLNSRTGHPEARYQKNTQAAFMDVIGS